MDQKVSFDGNWDKVKEIVKNIHNIKNKVDLYPPWDIREYKSSLG